MSKRRDHLMTRPIQATATSGQPIGDFRGSLAQARDEQLTRVVALVDALQERGAADDLLAPLRARIAELRPPRPLNFARLLFLPLDPLIVPAARWTAGSPAIPRDVIVPLAHVIQNALGPEAQPIQAAIAGRLSDDANAIVAGGKLLWPAAAQILKQAPTSDCAPAGLANAASPQLVACIAFVLEHAMTVQHLVDIARRNKRAALEKIRTLLEVSITVNPWDGAMLVALLLARLPRAELLREVLSWFGRLDAEGGRAVLDSAVNFFLDELERRGSAEGPLAGVELSQAGNEIARLATILNELATHYGDAFERRRRLENLRRSINESCRRRFEKGLTCELIEPLKALPEQIDPIVITAFEDTARNLRRLEFAVRQVGDSSRYDELLRNTMVIVREEIRSPALTLADRIRLIELLAGPEEALAMMEGRSQRFST